MNSLVKVPPYFKLNFQGKYFFTQNKVRFLPRVDTFSSDMLFIVSKQCACSRQAHIEGHMNRGGFILILVIMDNNSDNDSLLERPEGSATRPNSH
jgi:hypothetical protein